MQQPPSIDIERDTSSLDPQQVADKVTNMVATLKEQFGLTTSWHEQSRAVLFESVSGLAKGTKGYLQLLPKSIKLAVHLTPMLVVQKAAIEQEINAVLDQNLTG
jgi:putative polyhydroxyalkanoate system protein